MNASILLTALGLVVAVVLGVWTIVLAVRYSRRVQITFIEESCLSLLADIAQGIEALEVRYQGTPVSRNLVLLRGYFMNTGNQDITPSMMEMPPRLSLPGKFKWMDCRVTKTSKDLKARVAGMTSNAVEFDLGLFKTNEYFKFDALASVPAEDLDAAAQPKGNPQPGLRDALGFDHRITDAGRIQTLALHSLADTLGTGRASIGTKIAADVAPWVAVATILFATAFTMAPYRELAFRVIGPAGDSIVVSASVKGDLVTLDGVPGYKRTLTASEFDTLSKTPVLRLRPVARGNKRVVMFGGAVVLLMGLLLLVPRIAQNATSSRYRSILDDSTSSTRPPLSARTPRQRYAARDSRISSDFGDTPPCQAGTRSSPLPSAQTVSRKPQTVSPRPSRPPVKLPAW